MEKSGRLLLIVLLILAVSAVGAVCLHSLEEIHYLKSFYPRTFTVQEAYLASAVELIKVVIITIPLVLSVAVCLFFLRKRD